MSKKVLFIDRDGTIIVEPPEDSQVDSLEKLQFLPGAISALREIALSTEYELVMVTNQDGLGTDSFPENTYWPAHQKMLDILKGEGVEFSETLIDRSRPEEKLPTRKPGTGMLQPYIYGDYNLRESYVIGDRRSDMQLAHNLGCRSIFIGTTCDLATVVKRTWPEILTYLTESPRIGHVERKTKETNIDIELNLDGNGLSKIRTGLRFLDHMLEQLARHGSLDMTIDVNGDLDVDEHHTVEDTAIALGQAFDQALGEKRGIERYGFLLPMDDALAQVAIDFGGRPWLEWDVTFNRSYVGDVPTEMWHHFYKSFCDGARCNLNITCTADNDHHRIESIFKATAKAIKTAVTKTGTTLPTTKGLL